MRRGILAAISLCALVLLAFPALASAASVERFSFSESGEEPHFNQCDGFEIGLSSEGTVSGTLLFDATGEVVKVIVHVEAIDTLTNSVTGKTVVNRGEFEEMFTRIDGTDEFTHALVGFRYMGTSPGEGLVFQDVGRIVYSSDEQQILFLAGQHPVPDDGAGTVFCEALA